MPTFIYSDTPEQKYASLISQTHRKKYAQFFTPFKIAEFMASWIVGDRSHLKILDPAVGLGIFIRAAHKIDKHLQFIGYDIDAAVLSEAKKLFSHHSINAELSIKDYLFNDWQNKYDGIISNPPYLKFQDFKNRVDALQEFQSRLGIKLSGFSNIYTLFLIKSLCQLNWNGKAAYIIPSEFLNADYGKNVKAFLLKNRMLRYVFIFDFKKNIFENALTTASIFLFSNDDKNEEVKFINISQLKELEAISFNKKLIGSSIKGKTIHYDLIKPDIKWRRYYQESVAEKYKNLKNLVPFTHYAKVSRGIATGANDYFTFDNEKRKNFSLPSKYLLPCICKSNQVKDTIFTWDSFHYLKNHDHNVYLFDAQTADNEAVKSYLALGEKLEIHKKYLTRHRTPWYAIENRLPAPIWVGVFNRNGLKFIRNEANIKNLTAFHCIYVNLFSQNKLALFFSYLLTDIAKEIFSDNRREYGGGLEKFEPNDLNKSYVLNLEVINSASEKIILERYNKYRLSVINGQPDNCLQEELNHIFLKLLQK